MHYERTFVDMHLAQNLSLDCLICLCIIRPTLVNICFAVSTEGGGGGICPFWCPLYANIYKSADER